MSCQPTPLEDVVVINPKEDNLRSIPDDTLVSFVPMHAVSEKTATIITPSVRPIEKVRRGYTVFRNDDVLFAKITPCMENGKTALASRLQNGIGFGSTEFHILRPGPLIVPQYLHYFVRRESFRNAAKQHMRGAVGQQRVPEEFLRKEPIPVPALSKQHRIIKILDQADRLCGLRAVADVKYKRVVQALFTEMFRRFRSDWTVTRLGSVLRPKKGALQSGPFGSHLHNHDFVPSGTVLAVGIDNVLDGQFVIGRNRRITREKYRELRKYTLEPGDVLITIMGTVGRTCVFPGEPSPAICTKQVYRIQPDRVIDPDYLCATLRFSQHVRSQLGSGVTGQIVSGIKSETLKRLEICIPPLCLQSEFARRKRAIDYIQQRASRAREIYNALLAGLMHVAFTGNLTGSRREARMEELLKEVEHQKAAESVSAEGDRD